MNQKQREQKLRATLVDRDWWKEFGNRFGWTLNGFYYRDTASFFVGKHETIRISKVVRESIDHAWEERKQHDQTARNLRRRVAQHR